MHLVLSPLLNTMFKAHICTFLKSCHTVRIPHVFSLQKQIIFVSEKNKYILALLIYTNNRFIGNLSLMKYKGVH